jgi:peptidoglycan/LPS O-acetylase OafA/YrhL
LARDRGTVDGNRVYAGSGWPARSCYPSRLRRALRRRSRFANRTGSHVGLILDRIFYVGWCGVDLFFVLSGFLITSILIASRDMPSYFRRFYGRRALRILPLYYLLVVLVVFVIPRALPTLAPQLVQEAVTGQIWLWTYTLNIAVVFGWVGNTGLLAHFWSLAIEEQYYLVWPMLVKKLRTRMLVSLCLVLIAGGLALRIIWIVLGWGWQGAYMFTLSRADGLALGALIAVLATDQTSLRRVAICAPYVLTIAGAVLTIMFLSVPRFYATSPIVVTWGHSLLALTFGSLLVRAIGTSSPPMLSFSPLRAIGKYSYGTYVWHWPLLQILFRHYPIRTTPSLLFGWLEATAFLVGRWTRGIVISRLGKLFSDRAPLSPLEALFRIPALVGSQDLGATGGRKDDLDHPLTAEESSHEAEARCDVTRHSTTRNLLTRGGNRLIVS